MSRDARERVREMLLSTSSSAIAAAFTLGVVVGVLFSAAHLIDREKLERFGEVCRQRGGVVATQPLRCVIRREEVLDITFDEIEPKP